MKHLLEGAFVEDKGRIEDRSGEKRIVLLNGRYVRMVNMHVTNY